MKVKTAGITGTKKAKRTKEARVATVYKLPVSRRGEGPNPIDIHVGHRLRIRRVLLGLSQEKLGASIGLTFQQLQKYERGVNRISASRLFQLSKVLDVSVSFFFDDFDENKGFSDADLASQGINAQESYPLANPETLALIRAYFNVESFNVRKKALNLLRTLGGEKAAWPDGEDEVETQSVA